MDLESRVLAGNPLGDPATRQLAVYRPPSGVTEGKPLLLHLPGFTGAGWLEAQRERMYSESLFRVFDRLVTSGRCGEAVLIAPDCATLLGGSQYVNSSATGRYEDYVMDEVLPWAKETLHTGPTGILGQSSGGFGALHLAMNHPDQFQAVGSSAGDMAFDLCFLLEIPRAVRRIREAGGPEELLGRLIEEPGLLRSPTDPTVSALILLAMGACYSPRSGEGAAFDLPFDVDTGEIVLEIWERWLRFDPVTRLKEESTQAALRRLRSVHVTASRADEWYLDLAARRFARVASMHGVPVIHEEFEGGHFDRSPRFEALFRRMVEALTRSSEGAVP
ncbi:MAG: alpha/beta hydrolase-fold protein [Thermoplasmata archaeon]